MEHEEPIRMRKAGRAEAMTDLVVGLFAGARLFSKRKTSDVFLDGNLFMANIHEKDIAFAQKAADDFRNVVMAPQGWSGQLKGSVAEVLDLRQRVRDFVERRLEKPPDALDVFWLISEPISSGYMRAQLPSEYLEHHNVFVDISTQFEADPEDYDLFVFERQYHPIGIDAIEGLRQSGKPCVFETDDNCFAVPAEIASIQRFDASAALMMRRLVQKCNWVIVSTPTLKRHIGEDLEYGPHLWESKIHVVENAIPYSVWSEARKLYRQEHEGLRILWAGGSAHGFVDAGPLFAVVKHFAEKNAPVKFVFAGIPIQKLAKNEFAQYVEFHNAVPPTDYPTLVALLSPDIGIAPLAQNRFNEGKSNLKWLEYTAAGIPTIASAVGPYKESIAHGQTGLLVHGGPEQWVKSIQELLDSSARRDELVGAALQEQKARGYDIEATNAKPWADTFRDCA